MAESTRPHLPPRLFFAYMLATGFGSGYMRPAPGSWGSATALLIAIAILPMAGLAGLLLMTALAFLAGLPAVAVVEDHEGVCDPPHIVIDEFCGQWLAYAIVLAARAVGDFSGLDGMNAAIAAFVAFRLFDIVKVWPISLLEQRKGAIFTLLDDILAGVLAGLAVWGLAALVRIVIG